MYDAGSARYKSRMHATKSYRLNWPLVIFRNLRVKEKMKSLKSLSELQHVPYEVGRQSSTAVKRSVRAQFPPKQHCQMSIEQFNKEEHGIKNGFIP